MKINNEYSLNYRVTPCGAPRVCNCVSWTSWTLSSAQQLIWMTTLRRQLLAVFGTSHFEGCPYKLIVCISNCGLWNRFDNETSASDRKPALLTRWLSLCTMQLLKKICVIIRIYFWRWVSSGILGRYHTLCIIIIRWLWNMKIIIIMI